MKKRRVFAGIDWGGHEHQLCVVDADGRKQLELRVNHDVAGLKELVGQLARHGERVPVALERAEGLLVEHLQAHDHPVFPVSPRISARARERYRVAPINYDRFDAFVLADTLRHEHQHWRALAVPSLLLAELRALTRDRDRLLETQQTTEAQLRSIMEAYHPAPARLFSSMDRQIALAFIADYPTPAVASRVRTTRMSGFLRRNGYTGRIPAQVLAERMRANLLSGSVGTVAGRAHSAKTFAHLLGVMNEALAEFDDAIDSVVAEHPDAEIFASFPGVGPVLTAVLLAEIGEDRTRYPSVQTLLAESGLAPVTRSSGRSRNVRFRYAATSGCGKRRCGGRSTRSRPPRGRRRRSARPATSAGSAITVPSEVLLPGGCELRGAAGRTAPPTTRSCTWELRSPNAPPDLSPSQIAGRPLAGHFAVASFL
jgi:transposase